MTLYHCVGMADSSSRIFVRVSPVVMARTVVIGQPRAPLAADDTASAVAWLRSDAVPLSIPAVRGVADLTPAWCSAALGTRVTHVDVEPVGTGQVADTFRLRLGYDDPSGRPPTLVAKVPAAAETSRIAARLTRTYEVEASFYRDLAPGLPVRAPACHHAAHDPDGDSYVVLLEDVAPAEQGDQMRGCTVDEIAAAVDEMALLHAPRWGDESLLAIDWLHRAQGDWAENTMALIGMAIPTFRDRYRDRLDADANGLIDRFLPLVAARLRDRPAPLTIVHGDFRADNLLFGGDRVVVVDWQTVATGPGPADLSYLLGASLTTEDRRRHEDELVDRYVERLGEQGVTVERSAVWQGYRRHAVGGVIMAIVASFLVERTDRGDEMFVTMARRHARHVLDLGADGPI